MERIARVRLAGAAFLILFSFHLPVWAQRPRYAGVTPGPTAPANASSPVSTQHHHPSRFPGGNSGVMAAPTQQPGILFPTALGNNVGLQAIPSVGMTPGIGNINQPGLPPGAPTVYPNINNPAAAPIGLPSVPNYRHPGNASRHDGEHRGRGAGGPIFVPYYYAVPYYVYPGNPGFASAPPQPNYAPYPVEPEPAPSPERFPPSTIYIPPASVAQPEQPSQPPAPAESQPAPEAAPQPRPVTILAFKDSTIVAVTDYWLKGADVYYKRGDGSEAGVPIDQLDFPLTEQLNRERHVPLVLEYRPD